MFAARITTVARTAIIARSTPALTTHVVSRNLTSGPPRVRVSFTEKLAHGTVITVGVLFLPFYIMANMKNYKAVSSQ